MSKATIEYKNAEKDLLRAQCRFDEAKKGVDAENRAVAKARAWVLETRKFKAILASEINKS